jgi:hypothetical protein
MTLLNVFCVGSFTRFDDLRDIFKKCSLLPNVSDFDFVLTVHVLLIARGEEKVLTSSMRQVQIPNDTVTSGGDSLNLRSEQNYELSVRDDISLLLASHSDSSCRRGNSKKSFQFNLLTPQSIAS